MTLTWRFAADLAERTVRTFVQAYGGYWIAAGPDFDHLFTVNGLKVAAVAAALAVFTALAVKPVGNPDSASALPPAAQPPAPQPIEPAVMAAWQPPAPEAVPQPSIGKVTAEALAAIEAMRQGMANLAPQVAQEVVTHLDEQVSAAPRRARPAEPSDLEHGVYWAPPPPPANRQPIRVGSRVKVLSGKLEGRWGSVIESVAGRSLVFEDGPDDVDDWVPNDQLEPLGEWVTP